MIKIGNTSKNISVYTSHPKNKKELKEIIQKRILDEGSDCDLNDIDTSEITDMSHLFEKFKFNGDISNWNVSNVKNMACMFAFSDFNGDISRWDVSNVKNMRHMFAYTDFNGDISNWDVSSVEDMSFMFYQSKFNQDISKWNINDRCNTFLMFIGCIRDEFKPKSIQKK